MRRLRCAHCAPDGWHERRLPGAEDLIMMRMSRSDGSFDRSLGMSRLFRGRTQSQNDSWHCCFARLPITNYHVLARCAGPPAAIISTPRHRRFRLLVTGGRSGAGARWPGRKSISAAGSAS